MRKVICMIIVACSVLSCHKEEHCADTSDFYRLYGGSGYENIESIICSGDGGYVSAGFTESNDGDITGSHGGREAWVVKVDKDGIIDWQRPVGGAGSDNAHAITSGSDGKYVIAGYSYSNDGDWSGNHGGQDAIIVKLNSDGTTLWHKIIGGSQSDAARSIEDTPDGGYIIAGLSNSNNGDVSGNHGSFDFWILKLDRNGNTTWQRSSGGSGVDVAYSVSNTLDGGYVVAGETASSDGDITNHHGNTDAWIIKLDRNGKKIWEKAMGNEGNDQAYSIILGADGNYIVSGSTEVPNDSGGEPNRMTWVFKLNSQGNLMWQKTFDIEPMQSSIINSTGGGYALVTQSWLLKLDHQGNLQWQKTVSGTLYSVVSRLDGSYVAGGGVPNQPKNADALLTTIRK